MQKITDFWTAFKSGLGGWKTNLGLLIAALSTAYQFLEAAGVTHTLIIAAFGLPPQSAAILTLLSLVFAAYGAWDKQRRLHNVTAAVDSLIDEKGA